MRLLGAILAGGQSRRFGSDKALAQWRGRALLDHVRAALAAHVETVVVCGRELPDRPGPGLGPLGGLNAALAFAAEHGFDRVLTVPCDAPQLSGRLLAALTEAAGPAILPDLPVIGAWPVSLAPRLDAWLGRTNDRSMRAWAAAAGATALAVAPGDAPVNINRPADLTNLG